MIIAEAYRDAQKVKGEGDAKASAIFADAFGRDPQFAQFYRSLEAAYGINPEFFAFWRSLDAYRAGLRGRNDVLVLDPSSEFFRYFRQSGGRDGARGTAK